MTNSDAVRRGLVFRTAPTEALTAGLPGCRCFLAVAAGASNDLNFRSPAGWSRRRPDIPDRGGGRRGWGDSARLRRRRQVRGGSTEGYHRSASICRYRNF
jgi:hypothetical protein